MTPPLGERVFGLLLRAYPRTFRQRYGGELLTFFRVDRQHPRYGRGPLRPIRFWAATIGDLLQAATKERMTRNEGRPGTSAPATIASRFGGITIDLRDAARRLVGTRSSSLVAAASLALGIGATTAVFALAYGIWLKPLPYGHPDALVIIQAREMKTGRPSHLTGSELEEYRQVPSLADVAAYADRTTIAEIRGERVRVLAYAASPNLFDVLAVSPARGPGFSRSGSAPEVVLGDALWRRQFGADPDVIGRVYRMFDQPYTIVGIMPSGFHFPQVLEADAWIRVDRWNGQGDRRIIQAIGRLRPTATIDQVRRELTVAASRLAVGRPGSNAAWTAGADSLSAETLSPYARPFGTLVGMTVLLLILACANAAAILLSRTAARRAELSMRTALGATRLRLARELLVEGTLLTLVATIAGILMAIEAMPLLRSLLPAALPRLDEVRLDGRVLAVTIAASAATALVCGLLPLLAQRAASSGLGFAGVDRRVAGDPARGPLRALAIAEIAITVVLVVSSGQMLKAFVALTSQDHGFDGRGLLTLDVSLPFSDDRYEDVPLRSATLDELLARAQTVPGVTRVGATTGFPGSALGILGVVTVQADPSTPAAAAAVHACSDDYFTVMGTRLEAGRPFDRRDRTEPNVILGHTLAVRLWPSEPAVGQTLTIPPIPGVSQQPETYRVIGVAQDMQLTGRPTLRLYLPFSRAGYWIDLVARTDRDPQIVAPALRAALLEANPNLLIEHVRGMDRILADSVSLQRAQTLLVSLTAGVAALLAAVGLYGLLSYTTVRRMRELGVRVALGATPRGIFAALVRDALVLAGTGAGIGIVLAALAARLLRQQVFGLTTVHWSTFAAAPLLMAVVALVAVWAPARRAATIDPLVVMREG